MTTDKVHPSVQAKIDRYAEIKKKMDALRKEKREGWTEEDKAARDQAIKNLNATSEWKAFVRALHGASPSYKEYWRYTRTYGYAAGTVPPYMKEIQQLALALPEWEALGKICAEMRRREKEQ